MKDKKEFGYILRYYLPVEPNFSAEFTKKRFDELLSFCKENKVGAVIFYVALDPNFYYMPDTPEYAKSWRDQMLPYIKEIKKHGISYQLNFQNLLGATTAGVDFRYKYDWEHLVDQHGNQSACGCPIGEKFRAKSSERLKVWAETDPDVIWIDDDIRLHGHGNPQLYNGNYIDHYCFCDNHLALFNKKYGVNYDRESLIKEILQKGQPTFARKAYLEFLSETMADTAKWIYETVHDVNPRIKIALMTSAPDSHSAEGRDWGKFLSALGGGDTVMLRPTFGPYQEGNPKDFTSCYSLLSQMRAHVRETFDGCAEFCPEVENTRFTVYAKSRAATSFQLALAAFTGCKDITLSLYDLEGCALSDEPNYGKMLKDEKEFLNKLRSLNLDEFSEYGVVIPTTGKGGYRYSANDGATYSHLRGGERYIHSYLLKVGVPCAFKNVDELDCKGVVALDAYTANILTDTELKTVLSGGVLIDAGGAEKLIERGYCEYIGINKVSVQSSNAQSEIINAFSRADGTNIKVPSRAPAGCWYSAKLCEKAEVLSEFMSPEGKKSAGFVSYKNALGGKVITYLCKGNWGDGFYTHYRVKLLKDLLKNLGLKNRIDGVVYSLFAVKKLGEKEYYLVTNLSADTVKEFIIDNIKVKDNLKLYQTGVYERTKNGIKKVGKLNL
ncbi:MAG: hypothetical protein E7340_05635 [Clostridiales bacterium]|nr:hypothetical protein [Clostridiales bacterium]MBE5754791.1 hypothetical protein [Clostridiales bacterium]